MAVGSLSRTVGDRLAERIPERRLSASTMLAVYCVLLFGIPARLIVPQIGAPGTPANLWGLFMLVAWTAARLSGKLPRDRRTPVKTAILVLTLAVIASYVAAMSHGWYAPPAVRQSTDLLYDLVPASADEIRGAMISAADRGLLSFAGWVGVTLVAVDGLRTWDDVDRVLRWLVYACVFVATVGIVQYFTGLQISGFYKIPGLRPNADFGYVDGRSVLRRVQATASGAIEFGVVTAGVAGLALHRALFSPRSWTSWVPPVAIGFAAALSISRSAILVLAISLVVLLLGWPTSWRRRCYRILPLAVIGVRLAAPGVVGTIRALFLKFGQDNSVTGRTQDYAVVFDVFGQHPVLGRGLFTFVPRYYRILDNQILMFLLELGIIGTTAVFVFVGAGFMSARHVRRRASDEEHRHLGLALSATILAVFVSFATYDAFSFPMAAGLVFLTIGLAGAAHRLTTAEHASVPAAT